MKQVDVVIIGAGQAGQSIATALTGIKKEIVLVSLPGSPEDYFQGLIQQLTGKKFPPPSANTISATTAKQTPYFLNKNTLFLNGEEIKAKYFVVASGCVPHIPVEFQKASFQLPLDILAAASPPSAVSIVGTGPVGVATAAFLSQKKCQVTLITRGSQILSKEEPEIAAAIHARLLEMNVKVDLNVRKFPMEGIVLATGLRSNTKGMELPKAGIYVTEDNRMVVDETMRSPNKYIFGAGTVTGAYFNLNYEQFQAELVGANIPASFFNVERQLPEPIPQVFPFSPPFSRIGLTEKEAKLKPGKVIATTTSNENGTIKLVGNKKTTELLGAHIFSQESEGLIVYFDLLMRAGVPLREVTEKHHYPSMGVTKLAEKAVEDWLRAAGE